MIGSQPFPIVENDLWEEYAEKRYLLSHNRMLQITGPRVEIELRSCIFLANIIILQKEINMDFHNAYFMGNFLISSSNSTRTQFKSCIFSKKFVYTSSTFDNGANFKGCSFLKGIDLNNSNFEAATDFELNHYKGEACFFNTVFKDEANFNYSIFEKRVDFAQSKINRLYFSRVKKKDKNEETNQASQTNQVVADFKGAAIDYLFDAQTSFEKFTNHESALVLKQAALKNHDQKKALDFYVQEMDLYRTHLKKDGQWLDQWILGFESWVSNYGTNPVKAIGLIVGLALLIAVVFTCFTSWSNCLDFLAQTVQYFCALFNLTAGAKALDFTSLEINSAWLGLILLFKNIAFAIMAYEIIKSFRKFSRKL